MELFEFLRSSFDLGLHSTSQLLLVQPFDSVFELLDSVLGLLDLYVVSLLNDYSLGVNRWNVLEGVDVVLSGSVDELDDGNLLSSEDLDQVLVAHLLGLILLAAARSLFVGDDLLTGLLANLDDRSNLDQVLLLQGHLSLEDFSSLGSDAVLLDEDESLLLSDSLETLLFLDDSSSSGFLFESASNSEFLFSPSSEFLLDLLLSLDEIDVSGHDLDLSSDNDKFFGDFSAEAKPERTSHSS